MESVNNVNKVLLTSESADSTSMSNHPVFGNEWVVQTTGPSETAPESTTISPAGPHGNRGGARTPALRPGVISAIHTTCWYLPAQLDSLKLDLLMDSGSTYTILDHALFMSLPQETRPNLRPVSLILRVASGDVIPVHGEVTMNLVLDAQSFPVDLKIVSLGERGGILGLDFMHKYDCTVHMSKGLLQLGTAATFLKMVKKKGVHCTWLEVDRTTCIPPRHEAIVYTRIPKSDNNYQGPYGLVEPVKSFSQSRLAVAKSVVAPNEGLVPVQVANFTSEPIQLQGGSVLAQLGSLEEDEVTPFEPATALKAGELSADANTGEVPSHLQPIVDGVDPSVPETGRLKLKQLLREYEDVFMAPDGKMGRTDLVKFEIPTGNARPVRQKLRLPPLHMQEAVDKEIDKLLDAGIIEPSRSPWGSNLVCVRKKSGDLRICADFRGLNQCLQDIPAYPLPRIEDCLQSLAGSQWFSTVDLAMGFHQVMIHPRDKEKTSIITRRGQFQYVTMPMGIASSPCFFEALMESVLRGLQWSTCILYLDDIITLGKDLDSAIQNLADVFQRFRDNNLKLKPSKCKLLVKSVQFLGHLISPEGIQADPSKIEAVKTWPVPTSAKETRSFLGFAQYYKKHIKNFSEVATPLHALTRKRCVFRWSDEAQKSFETLKSRLVEAPCLAYPDRDAPFILDTDASLYSVGSVLAQIDSDGDERPVAYGSVKLSKSQQNLCTTMRELLAVVIFLRKYHHYLIGRKFTLRTDHHSLLWLHGLKESSGVLARWLTTLGNYRFDLVHRKGNLHMNADALSRIPGRTYRTCKREDCPDCLLRSQDCVCALGMAVEQTSGLDESLCCLDRETQTDPSEGVTLEQKGDLQVLTRSQGLAQQASTSHSTSPVMSMGSFSNWMESWTPGDIRKLQHEESQLKKIIELKEAGAESVDREMFQKGDDEVRSLLNQWPFLEVVDGILYRRWEPQDPLETECTQIVVPPSLRVRMLKSLHSDRTGGHLGIAKVLGRLRKKFYWPGHKRDVERWIKQCKVCQQTNRSLDPKKAPLQPKPVYQRFERIQVDLAGPFVTSRSGNSYIMVVGDAVSKWCEAYPVPDMTAYTVADVLSSQWFCRMGVASQVHTDQGRCFESELFKELCRIWDVHKTRTARFRPNSNGFVESINKTVKKMLKSFAYQHPEEWEDHLPYLMMAYRCSPHASTHCSANLLTFGEEIRCPVDVAFAPPGRHETQPRCPQELVEWIQASRRRAFRFAQHHLKESANRAKRYYDRQTFPREFAVGQFVWVFNPPRCTNKCSVPWEGPYLVVKKFSNVNYVVQRSPTSRKITLHIDHMKQYDHDTPESWLDSDRTVETSSQTE